MADEQTTRTIAPQPEPAPATETKPDPLGAEVERAHEAAAAFLAEQNPTDEAQKPDRPRGPDGKFLPKEAQGTEAQGTEASGIAEPASPKLDGAWVEAAKIAGFREDEIAAFKSDQDLQKEVMWRRQQVMQSVGIDPNEFQAFQQWRQQTAQQQYAPQDQPPYAQQPRQQPQQQPQQQPTALADLKLDIDEQEIAPELVKPLRDVQQFANQVKATLGAENAQLKQMMVGLYGMVQQSAEAQQRAALEAQQAAEWDNAAKEVPGFVEVMGLPSEVRRMAQLNPNDPKVQNYIAFRAYFEPTFQRYAQVLGQGAPLPRVMADAFSASPFARLVGTNGRTNGQSGPQPGSVVRGTARRGSSAEPAPKGDPLAVEAERIHATIDQVWSQAGNNPFRE